MIGLLGATGYTGRVVAAELARRRLPHRLGARNPERLQELPTSDEAEKFVVDASDSARLDAFLAGVDALITTVGPFSRFGGPVVDAAVRNRVPYVDSTGETDFMTDVYLRHVHAPVALVPACGFDYIPGDLVAAVAAGELEGEVSEINVAYANALITPSRGTLRTATDQLGSIDAGSARTRRIAFPDGTRVAVELPWGEQLTVPRHVPGARVASMVVVPGPLAPVVERLAGPFVKAAGAVLRPIVERMPEGPPEQLRRRARFELLAEAIGPGGRAAVRCQGRDVYGLTARFMVEAADRLQRGEGLRETAGALAPGQAFEPVPFLDAVSGDSPSGSFTWERVA